MAIVKQTIRPCFSEGDITYTQIEMLMLLLNTQDMKGLFRVAIAEMYAKERQNRKMDISGKIPRFPHERMLQ